MPKVLVIADAGWVINDVLATLPQAGWEVEVLDDSSRSAEVVTEVDPDAVIIDFQVRSMGGMAVVRHLRASIDPEKMPRMVLLLDRDADTFLARRAGADAWVLKPFSAQELRDALSGVRA